MMKFLKDYENLQNWNFLKNPFNKDKFMKNTMHKKGLIFSPVVEFEKLKFIYITVVK